MDIILATLGLNPQTVLENALTYLLNNLRGLKEAFIFGSFFDLDEYNRHKADVKDIEDFIVENPQLDFRNDVLGILRSIDEFNILIRQLEASRRFDRYTSRESNLLINGQEGIERYSQRVLGERNQWAELAVENNLFAKDRPRTTPLQIHQQSDQQVNIVSVVDEITEESIKGKDLARELEVSDGEFSVLKGDEATSQNIITLLHWFQGKHPYLPNIGLNEEILNAPNKITLIDSVLLQFQELIRVDDLIQAISIRNITEEGTALKVSFNVTLRTGEEQVVERTL